MKFGGEFEGTTTHLNDFEWKDGEKATAFRPVEGQNRGSIECPARPADGEWCGQAERSIRTRRIDGTSSLRRDSGRPRTGRWTGSPPVATSTARPSTIATSDPRRPPGLPPSALSIASLSFSSKHSSFLEIAHSLLESRRRLLRRHNSQD